MFSNLSAVGTMHGTNTKRVPSRERDTSRSHGWTSSGHGVRKVGFIENFVF